MSRSRRKVPIAGVTTASSEKWEKQAYNRRYRRASKEAMRAADESRPLPVLREYSDPWMMRKDGKRLFGGGDVAAIMRK